MSEGLTKYEMKRGREGMLACFWKFIVVMLLLAFIIEILSMIAD